MIKKKTFTIGNLYIEDRQDGSKNRYIGLGQKSNKKPEYNTSVEVIVRNSKGEVVHKQLDGFINLSDPRTEPEELYKAGIITEEQAGERLSRVQFLPEKLKYNLKASAKQ